MKKLRKKFSAQEKVSIMRRHFPEKVSVSDLCDEYGVAPTVFYLWQKQFFENGAATFECFSIYPLSSLTMLEKFKEQYQ